MLEFLCKTQYYFGFRPIFAENNIGDAKYKQNAIEK